MGNLRQRYTEEEWSKLLKNDKVNSRNFEKREKELKKEKIKNQKSKKLKDWYTFIIKLQETQKEIESTVEEITKKVEKVLPNTPIIFAESNMEHIYSKINGIEGNEGGIKDFEAEMLQDSFEEFQRHLDPKPEKQTEHIEVYLKDFKPKQGVKLSSDKPPMAQLFKQFPLAFEQLALRSNMGHEKYKETDKDWMNWKRVPNAIFEYEQAKARHMLKIGEETDFEHLIAEAWNIMAIIQLKLENK